MGKNTRTCNSGTRKVFNMTLIEVQHKLLALKQPLFLTQDAAACLNVDIAHASKILTRLEKANVVKKISRGKWMLSTFKDSLFLPEFITSPTPSYISLQSALYYHGMISQIPSITYAVSLARTSRYQTPLGVISIHHIQLDFFFGFEVYQDSQIKMATPEKALLDVLYLTNTRTNLFKKLPEIELAKNFNIPLAKKMINKIQVPRLKTIMQTRFQSILDSQS